jgi:hypothetical protein
MVQKKGKRAGGWAMAIGRGKEKEEKLTSSSGIPFLGGSFLNSSASPSTRFMCRSKAINLQVSGTIDGVIRLAVAVAGRNRRGLDGDDN